MPPGLLYAGDVIVSLRCAEVPAGIAFGDVAVEGGVGVSENGECLDFLVLSLASCYAEEGGENALLFADLADICEANNGLWCPAAEKRILRDVKFN